MLANYFFASAILLSAPAAFASIYDATPAFCDAYAVKATSQYQTAQAARCEVSGLRWSDDEAGQKKWCEGVRENVAQAETHARAETLIQCLSPKSALNDSDLTLIPDALGAEMLGAVGKGKLTRVQQLLAAGADLDYEGMQGNDGKALFVAISNGQESLIKFFIGLGMNPNGTFNGGFSPITTLLDKPKLLDYVLAHGGEADNTGELYDFRELPIVSAINSNNLEALTILLKHGARVQIDQMMGDCTTDTLLDYALSKPAKPAIIAALRKAGAKKHDECMPQ